jgi:hypothetical protein
MCFPLLSNTREEKMNTYAIFVGNLERKRPLGRCAYRWNDNNKMDLKEIEWSGGTELIWLSVGTRCGSCEHGNELSVSIKVLENS